MSLSGEVPLQHAGPPPSQPSLYSSVGICPLGLSDQGLRLGPFLVSLAPHLLPGIFLFVQKNNTIIALFLIVFNLNNC